ncbi:MAG: hypothetical protein D6805_07875 [Planctomycetota bacterium]|nr:MAG: hypothetical protein D6805_07875 [Planctomycetota bacterium]
MEKRKSFISKNLLQVVLEWIGFFLFGVGVLGFISLVGFELRDYPSEIYPSFRYIHNPAGLLGARVAYLLLSWLGSAASFLFVIGAIVFGIGMFVEGKIYFSPLAWVGVLLSVAMWEAHLGWPRFSTGMVAGGKYGVFLWHQMPLRGTLGGYVGLVGFFVLSLGGCVWRWIYPLALEVEGEDEEEREQPLGSFQLPLELLESERGALAVELSRDVEGALKNFFQKHHMEATLQCLSLSDHRLQYRVSASDPKDLRRLCGGIAHSLSDVSVRITSQERGSVCLEVSPTSSGQIHLRRLLDGKVEGMEIPLLLGTTDSGEEIKVDLAQMQGFLVAGSSSRAITQYLHNLMISLLFYRSSSQFRMILADPKRRLQEYHSLPHLALSPVCEGESLRSLWQNLEREAERRRGLFAQKKSDNIVPWVVVVEDLCEAMVMAGRELENFLRFLRDEGEGSKIYLILAAHRPSLDVITPTIKSFCGGCLSFALSSRIESRIVLERDGAELLSFGEAIYLDMGKNLHKLAIPYVHRSDIQRCVRYIEAKSSQ